MEVKLKDSCSTDIKVKTLHQYETLSQHISCSDLTELEFKTKERERAQPVKVALLLGSTSTNASIQRRMPERIPRVYTETKKVPLALKENENNTFRKLTERNIRRNLNLNFKSPKQKMGKKWDVTCSSLNRNKAPKIKVNDTTVTNSTIQQRKSFLLPPNSIKSMYCEQQLVKTKQKVKKSSDALVQKENRMQKLTNIKENIDLEESRRSKQMSQNRQTLQNVNISSHYNKRVHEPRFTWQSCKNAISTKSDNEKTCNDFIQNNCNKTSKFDSLTVELSPLVNAEVKRLNCPDIICRSKDMHTCLNKDSDIERCINDFNLEYMLELNQDQQLKNALLTTESNLMGSNYCSSSGNEKKSCIKRDTLLLLESNLKNLVNILHENSNKIKLILDSIREILDTDTTKTKEEQVKSYEKIYEETENEEIELLKSANIEFLQSQEDKENSEDLNLSSCNKNSSKKQQPAKFVSKTLSNTNQINISFENLENALGITYTSRQLTPIYKIKNYDNYDEPFLKEYMNLKSNFSILETPQMKKSTPSRKPRNVALNIQADKHYISNRILRSIQDLYDADSVNS